MPTIAILGRPNVGKSLLFNRLVRRELALVHDRPGVTRDRLVADTHWNDIAITLIDTGGICGSDADFRDEIDIEATLAQEAADVILWVTDGTEGIVPSDLEIAQRLRRARKPVLLVVNKLDEAVHDGALEQFNKLGFGRPYPTSAAHRRGLEELRKAALTSLPADLRESARLTGEATQRPTRLAIVGRPNVGKSSLINAILEDRRTIVSDISGTTRDAIEIPYLRRSDKGTQPFTLVDTAGMRQRRRIHDDLESSMTGRTVHAIKRSDLCVLVLEADAGVTLQDKKIAGHIHESGKACLIAVNKWDHAKGVKWQPGSDDPRKRGRTSSLMEAWVEGLRKQLYFLNYAPVLFTSALNGEGVSRLFDEVDNVARNLRTAIPTAPLNAVLHDAQARQPPPLRAGRRFKILYASPKAVSGEWRSPEIIGFCNDAKLLPDFWLQYLEGRLRDQFPLAGCPIRWHWRERKRKEPDAPRRGR